MPGYIFFSERGGLTFLNGLDFQTASVLLFPLVGLYAFTLVWAQVVIGSARSVLRKVYPGIITWHRRQGVLVLLLALLHPLLRYIGLGLGPIAYFKNIGVGVAPDLVFFVWLGYVQLFVIVVTATSALLRKRVAWLKTRWHTIHYANYALFVMVWVHSWFLGSDVRGTSLQYLWFFFAVTTLAGTVVRIKQVMSKRTTVTAPTLAADQGYKR